MAGIPKDLLWEGDMARIYFWAHPFFWYLVDRSRLEEAGGEINVASFHHTGWNEV